MAADLPVPIFTKLEEAHPDPVIATREAYVVLFLCPDDSPVVAPAGLFDLSPSPFVAPEPHGHCILAIARRILTIGRRSPHRRHLNRH